MTAQGFTDQGETKADNLLAGEFPRIVELATVSGGKYARGTILGKITASGKCTICTSAATDGSKDAYAILAEAVDTSEKDKQAVVYLTGEFNAAALTVGSGLTVDGLKDALRAKSIFIKNNQAY
ncbi:MAG: hypothetical protein BHW58_07600 [Azospirillum sp. 51_20]|jgi:hypothetical protein|nr:MAG: hypothetical protein BHW58_07600 [Azospirillum sp. 51_20]